MTRRRHLGLLFAERPWKGRRPANRQASRKAISEKRVGGIAQCRSRFRGTLEHATDPHLSRRLSLMA
jgi:hypothetical protein